MCLGDFNGHIARHTDGSHQIYEGHGIGQRNLEARMLLEFCLEKELCTQNTWIKREKNRKVIIRMEENKTVIDFVFAKKEH